jgi:hypothetical protein
VAFNFDGWAPAGAALREAAPEREECFLSERDALTRADEVIRAGVHRRITLIDGAGKELSGIGDSRPYGSPFLGCWRLQGG